MYIELDNDGNVLNTSDEQFAGGEWYPGDTVIEMVDLNRLVIVGSGGVLRIMPPEFQAGDWPRRAARTWNLSTKLWDSTGGQTEETDLEQAVRLLRDNPLPELPDITVPELPASPTNAEVIAQVRTHTTYIQNIVDEVVLHRKYVEGYRKVLLKVIKFIGTKVHRDG